MRCIFTNRTISTIVYWYQWTPFLSPLTPMESICEYWTTLHSHGLYLSNIGSNLFYFKNVSALASLHCRCNLTPVSNVYKAVAISLFSALNGLNKLLEMHFKFPFNLINIDNGTFNRAIMVRTQILVHRREPGTWISALFYRPT